MIGYSRNYPIRCRQVGEDDTWLVVLMPAQLRMFKNWNGDVKSSFNITWSLPHHSCWDSSQDDSVTENLLPGWQGPRRRWSRLRWQRSRSGSWPWCRRWSWWARGRCCRRTSGWWIRRRPPPSPTHSRGAPPGRKHRRSTRLSPHPLHQWSIPEFGNQYL